MLRFLLLLICVCNHLATTKRKECNPKSRKKNITVENYSKSWTNKIQLKTFKKYMICWALRVLRWRFGFSKILLLLFTLLCWLVIIDYELWARLYAFQSTESTDFTHCWCIWPNKWAIIAISITNRENRIKTVLSETLLKLHTEKNRISNSIWKKFQNQTEKKLQIT